jgi:flotillin
LDAEGIKKITEITHHERVLANEFSQRAAVQIEKENADSDIAKREQNRRNEEDMAKQSRAVTEIKANEEAEARKVIEVRRKEVETKRIESDEAVRLRSEDMNRAVQEREYTVRKERERLEQEAVQEGEEARVRRERSVSLSQMDKDVKIAEAAVEVERKKAVVVAEQKTVVEQEEEKMNIEARMTASRVREVTLIEADMNAKKEQVAKVVAAEAQRDAERSLAEADKIKVVTAAEAKRQEALLEAEKIQTLAAAEAEASEKRRHAMVQEAEGRAAQEASQGLAEAKVMVAKATARREEAESTRLTGVAEADVIRAKGGASAVATEEQAKAEAEGTKDRELAVATGIEAKGLAEAKAIEEKAKAMKLFHDAGRDHEEFRIRINKEREIELSAIDADKEIARAQSLVVAEALKSAKIDLVGGEAEFFQKIVKAVSGGKAVDRLIGTSQVLTDVKNSFFAGGAENFRLQLKKWVEDFGVKSDDLRLLTVGALLVKLLEGSHDSVVTKILSRAQQHAKDLGLADANAFALLMSSDRVAARAESNG